MFINQNEKQAFADTWGAFILLNSNVRVDVDHRSRLFLDWRRNMIWRRRSGITSFFFHGPQRSWAKVIFLQATVCPQGGGVSASVHAGISPRTRQPPGPGTHPPPDQAPIPLEQTPWTRQTPPREAHFSIRSTSGRYASYWNAFLFSVAFYAAQ